MKSEDEPITTDEWLIRLVWGSRVKSDRTPIIGISSFQPRRDEVAGISLFRRSCLNDPLDALNVISDELKRAGNAIVQISAAAIFGLSCSLRSDPIPQVPGHVVVPEINSIAYQAEKQRLQKWFLILANEASANILREPLT